MGNAIRVISGLCFLLGLSTMASAFGGEWEPGKDFESDYSFYLGLGLVIVSIAAWVVGPRIAAREKAREQERSTDEQSQPTGPVSGTAQGRPERSDLPRFFSPDNPPGWYRTGVADEAYWDGSAWQRDEPR
jgi:hypothetical protein